MSCPHCRFGRQASVDYCFCFVVESPPLTKAPQQAQLAALPQEVEPALIGDTKIEFHSPRGLEYT